MNRTGFGLIMLALLLSTTANGCHELTVKEALELAREEVREEMAPEIEQREEEIRRLEKEIARTKERIARLEGR